MLKFRIAEFKQALETGERFFVETGTVLRVKRFLGITYYEDITWEKDLAETGEAIGHKTVSKAMARVNDLKAQQPIYHEIK